VREDESRGKGLIQRHYVSLRSTSCLWIWWKLCGIFIIFL